MKKSPSISLCVVVKNEADGIQHIIRAVRPYADELIVVDGCSTDGTASFARREGVRVIRDHGRGRGDGVRTAMRAATGDIIVLFDGDGSHNPKDIRALTRPIMQGKADLVIASRRTGGSFDRQMNVDSLLRSVGADLLTMLVNHAFKTALTDILYSFRAIRSDVARKLCLASDDFAIEQEMVVEALRRHYTVAEIPSRENARAWGKSKLRTITGLILLWRLLGQIKKIQ